MLAIHNCKNAVLSSRSVANAYAKLSKCQQFTTVAFKICFRQRLQTLMQSYQNVSNSQLNYFLQFILISCKRLCKVIKMLAIHNGVTGIIFTYVVANAYAKLSKCQQFTTIHSFIFSNKALQTLMQSYQNVSNSQRSLF